MSSFAIFALSGVRIAENCDRNLQHPQPFLLDLKLLFRKNVQKKIE